MKKTMIVSYKVVESTKEVDLLEIPLYWSLGNGGYLRIIPNLDKDNDIVGYSITYIKNLSISHQTVLVDNILQGEKIIFENNDYTFLLLRNNIGGFDNLLSKTYFDNKLERIYNSLK